VYKCTVVCIIKFPCYGCSLLGLWVRNPPWFLDVFVVCMLFVVQVEASETGRSRGVLPSAYVPMCVIR